MVQGTRPDLTSLYISVNIIHICDWEKRYFLHSIDRVQVNELLASLGLTNLSL